MRFIALCKLIYILFRNRTNTLLIDSCVSHGHTVVSDIACSLTHADFVDVLCSDVVRAHVQCSEHVLLSLDDEFK